MQGLAVVPVNEHPNNWKALPQVNVEETWWSCWDNSHSEGDTVRTLSQSFIAVKLSCQLMCDFLVMPSLILSQIFSILFFRYCPSVQMTNLHIWSSCHVLSVDSLRNLKSVFSSEDNFSIQNFFNTLNCKVFYSLHPLSRETNLTAVFISRKENKSCWKKSYTKYLVSDISRSVYVAMWNCLSRWFSCIVVIISIRNQSLIVARGQCHSPTKAGILRFARGTVAKCDATKWAFTTQPTSAYIFYMSCNPHIVEI